MLDVFDQSKEVVFATILQNQHHIINSNRKDAIRNGKFVTIDSIENANAYICELVRTNLTNELRYAENTIVKAFEVGLKNTDLSKLIESPDVYYAAVALSKREFFIGRGDRNAFFEIILQLDPS